MPRGLKLASVTTVSIFLIGITSGPQLGAMGQRRVNPQVANPQDANPQIANPQVARAVDMYLKIEGVEGEAADKDHKGWIEIESWSWGASSGASSVQQREPSGAGPGTLTLAKPIDKSSPRLTQACANGRSVGRVVVHARTAGSGGYNEYVMEDAQARGCSQDSQSDRPTESLSLYYNKIEFRPARVTPRPAIQGGQTVR